MGMSNDYEIALSLKSDMVRLAQNIQMNKLLIIFLLQVNVLYAIEVKCNFEEVYGNGEVHQGLFF